MHIPEAAPILFIASVAYCLVIIFWTLKGSELPKAGSIAFKISVCLMAWVILQFILSEQLIYSRDMAALPPKIIVFGVLPLIGVMVFIFNYQKSQVFIDSLPLQRVTSIHMVRILVEFGLYYVYIGKQIPEIMTFTGQNFDILAGLTAPIMIYLGFTKKKLSRRFLLFWNFTSLGLLLYIIFLAFLSAPSPLQQIAFNQPNVAIFHAPYSLLPTFIVPAVIFMHLVAIRQLSKK